MTRRYGAVHPPTQHDIAGRRAHPIATKLRTPDTVNRSFDLSLQQRRYYNQGPSQCVAFSASQLMTLLNGPAYDPGWLYARCEESDGIPDGSGTTTDACLRILKDSGHVTHPLTDQAPTHDDPGAVPVRAEGIAEFSWFSYRDEDKSLNEARACIANGMPFLIASPWFSSFGNNRYAGATWIEPQSEDWGTEVGWHQYLIDGCFDDGEYLTSPNSWGWPNSQRISYAAFKRIIAMGAGPAAVTDYPSDTQPRSFVCRFDGKTFATKRKLRRHMRRRHGRIG